MKEKKSLVIKTDEKDDIFLFNLRGNLNAYTAPDFENSLKGAIKKTSKIILDLRKLDYISSTGLGVIIGYLEDIREQGGDIKICLSDNPIVEEIFEITGFYRIIKFYEELESAYKSFSKNE